MQIARGESGKWGWAWAGIVSAVLASSIVLMSCAQPSRHVASDEAAGESASYELQQRESTAFIKYYSWDDSGPVLYRIDPARWAGANRGFSAGGRYDFLIRFWSATTRDTSNSGRKNSACFEGAANDIARLYFDPSNPAHTVRFIEEGVPPVTVSADGNMLGVQFRAQAPGARAPRTIHFRLPNCAAGKSRIVRDEDARIASADDRGFWEHAKVAQERDFDANRLLELGETGRTLAAAEDGYEIEDKPRPTDPADLPRFSLKADYSRAREKRGDRPWAGLDVRNEKDALKLAVLLQKYAYEGMANQDARNPDNNFIAQNSKTRYWCHMPWLNVGNSGREWVHGLTRERDLAPSPMMSVYANATPGTDWGIGFYNAQGCKPIGQVFGRTSIPKETPEFAGTQFPDGTVSVKILFTNGGGIPGLEQAVKWRANVSAVGSNARRVQDIRHIQMDIAVRDKSIKGTRADLNHWVMLTYYFDAAYDYDRHVKPVLGVENPLKSLRGLASGYFKMRPMGVQSGFEEPSTGDSIIVAGSETNGVGGRLNGPADNPRSSCLGCHGTAGSRRGMVPGVLKNADYAAIKAQTLDFSQQLSLAKRNYETRKK